MKIRDKKKTEEEPVKELTFSQKLLAEIANLDDDEQLRVIEEKSKANSEHIEKQQPELDSLKRSYDQEVEKQAQKVNDLRDRLFDEPASKMLDELQKISLPSQKKHLIDSIEKLKTSLLGLAMNKKDLLVIKREIESRIEEKAKDAKVRKLKEMMEELATRINAAEDVFFEMKNEASELSIGDPTYGRRADRLKFPPWIIQVMSMSGFNASSLPGLTLQSFSRMISAFPGNPLDEERKYQRGETVKKTGHFLDPPQTETIRGQDAMTGQSQDRAAESAIARAFTQ